MSPSFRQCGTQALASVGWLEAVWPFVYDSQSGLSHISSSALSQSLYSVYTSLLRPLPTLRPQLALSWTSVTNLPPCPGCPPVVARVIAPVLLLSRPPWLSIASQPPRCDIG